MLLQMKMENFKALLKSHRRLCATKRKRHRACDQGLTGGWRSLSLNLPRNILITSSDRGHADASTSKAEPSPSPSDSMPHGCDLYSILGLRADDDIKTTDIKVAYRQLARIYHPDIRQDLGAQQKFKLVSQAYDVLSNKERRQQYDALGMRALNGKIYAALHEYFGTDSASSGTWSGRPREPGADVYAVVGMPLAETVTGIEKMVKIDTVGLCSQCQGAGVPMGAASEACNVCHGLGEVLTTVWGMSSVRNVRLGTCPACGGCGAPPQQSCRRCEGEGRMPTRRTIRVSIPAGVEDGNVLRLRLMGGVGKYGGLSGDLYLRMHVHPDKDLERRGQDLHCNLGLPLFDAILGGQITVMTPRGERMLLVPPGTQPGDMLRLQNGGIAASVGGSVERGHHFFEVRVLIPDGRMMDEHEVGLLMTLSKLQSEGSVGNSQEGPQLDRWW